MAQTNVHLIVVIPANHGMPKILSNHDRRINLAGIVISFSTHKNPAFKQLKETVIQFCCHTASLPYVFQDNACHPLSVMSCDIFNCCEHRPEPIFAFGVPWTIPTYSGLQ